MPAPRELAWAGRPCDGCEVRRRSTTLCAFRARGGREARGYNLCEECRGPATRARARTKPLVVEPNARYARCAGRDGADDDRDGDGDARVPSLAALCVRMLAVGVLNRVPAMSAARLGPLLDGLAREDLMEQVLSRVQTRSQAFKNFVRESGWGPCPLDEDDDIGDDEGDDDAKNIRDGDKDEGKRGHGKTPAPEKRRSLDLANCRLTRDELEILGYFCETGVVSVLNVSWNRLGGAEAEELAKILRFDSCVQFVASWNAFGARGARAIGAGIAQSRRLVSLNMSANKLGPEGTAALCAGLQENASIEEVNISFNEIRAAGAQEVARMLKVNCSIRSINLRSNAMGPPGAFALADALRVNRRIKEFIVVDNNIGPEGAEAIAGFFQGSIPVLLRGIRGPLPAPS